MYFGEIGLIRGIRRRIVTKILIRLWRHDAWIRVSFLPCYSWTKLQFSSPRQWLGHCRSAKRMGKSTSVVLKTTILKWKPSTKLETFFSTNRIMEGGNGKMVALQISPKIHQMQIWRTTRSSPGLSYMKARLVGLRCIVLTMLLQKTLALWSICCFISLCLRVAVFGWMRREGIEIFHRSPLREDSGSMQFVETEKSSSRSPRELKFVCYVSG